jgi:hypothetical protein
MSREMSSEIAEVLQPFEYIRANGIFLGIASTRNHE